MNDIPRERPAPSAAESPRAPGEGLRLFLDSADPGQWQRFLPLGLFHGVTTNPLLLERSGQPCTLQNLETLARTAARLGAREIQLQTWGATAREMEANGLALARIRQPGLAVVVKVPATEGGFAAAAGVRDGGGQVTLTATYGPGQVLAAAGLGAAYAAPYLGRMNDAGLDGTAVLDAMRDILIRSQSPTRLLVASLRRADEVVDLARRGFDTFTFGDKVAAELFQEDLTETAAGDFQRAAEAMSGSGTD